MNQTILCIAFIVMSTSYVCAQPTWDIASPFTTRYTPNKERLPQITCGVSTSFYPGLSELRDNHAIVNYSRNHWNLGIGCSQLGYDISNISSINFSALRRLNNHFGLGLTLNGYRRYVERHQKTHWLGIGLTGSFVSKQDTVILQVRRSTEPVDLPYSTQLSWFHQLNTVTHLVATLSTSHSLNSSTSIVLRRAIGRRLMLSFLSGFNPLRLGVSVIWTLNKASIACIAHWNQYFGVKNNIVAWRTNSL